MALEAFRPSSSGYHHWTPFELSPRCHRRIAARHAHQLNETTKHLCRDLTQVTFIPFCLSEGAAEPALSGNSKTYQTWS